MIFKQFGKETKIQVRPLSRCFSLIWLYLSLVSLVTLVVGLPVSADTLVWKPYLQQITATSVIILWTTQTGADPTVRYAPDTSYTYSASGTTRLTALGSHLHRVELIGLQSNTTYYYKIYTDNQELISGEVLSFQTAPNPGSNTPFSFIAFGDYGTGLNSQKRLRDQMRRASFDFILTTGDNAYPDGSYAQFDAKVFQIYQDLFSQVPLFPTLGNHDYHSEAGAPYLDLFDLPQNAWRASDRERYYSFDYGNVHFVALDSNTPLYGSDKAADDDMFDWLRDDLSKTKQRWKIVVMHLPVYSTGPHQADSQPARTKLRPIFETYGVDLVLSGHDHIYQRSYPLRGGQLTTPEQGGLVYIITGAGSAASYRCGSADWVAVAYCSQRSGLYTHITVNGDKLTVEAIDANGASKDIYTLTKDPESPANERNSAPCATLGPIQFCSPCC
ncbi:MAG: hypothetical protein DPW09_26915 [Anaerolineae bacterium]|nr:hypothetical protein [Anaerolineae bacterium]